MWSNRKAELTFSAAATLLFAALALPLQAEEVPVCPSRLADLVERFDIFDGLPEERAFLQMERSSQSSGTLPLGHIFDAGGQVTVRCYYRSGATQVVQIQQRVERCTSRRLHDGSALLTCQ